jgi:arylsulfatase
LLLVAILDRWWQLYGPPFPFTGAIFKVTVDISGRSLHDTDEERNAVAKQAMARQ